MTYSSLFLSAFLSGTLLPGTSEILLLYWLSHGAEFWPLIVVATVGNTLGGATGYWLGRLGEHARIERYLGIKKERADRWRLKLQRFGVWPAFFTFLPIVGDVFIVVLGLAKFKAIPTLFLMGAGKFLRYLLLGLGSLSFGQ